MFQKANNNMIKVLIVDDSAMVRQSLKLIIDSAPDMTVIGVAQDPFVAKELILKDKPDVMTLDIEMPRMDGLTFLSKIIKYFPVPTIMVSSLTPEGGELAIEALDRGAVDVVAKPGVAYSVADLKPLLLDKIREANMVNMDYFIKQMERKAKRVDTPSTPVIASFTTTNKILAIGASTGGTQALEEVLTHLPANIPGTVIVQHMPAGFTASFAKRLNSLCPFEVLEAKDGDSVQAGRVLIAPGNYHMVIKRSGARFYVALNSEKPEFFQRPAVEVLFRSVAEEVGKNAVGVILTGMGSDGSTGLRQMRDAGARTIGQDEKSSIVYGMPKEAFAQGGVEFVEPLKMVAGKILELVK